MNIMLDKGAYIPERAHSTDAGYDIKSPVSCVIDPWGTVVIDTGVHIELPTGTVGMLKSKSGLNVNHSIVSEGVIDVGYTGSIKVKLYNHSEDAYVVRRGDKITQLVVLPLYPISGLVKVNKFAESERGDNGFGSSGR